MSPFLYDGMVFFSLLGQTRENALLKLGSVVVRRRHEMGIKNLIPLSILLLMLVVNIRAKEWRGIVPLHSTRADVVKILGLHSLSGDRYELENETVSILYSDGPCRTGGWNVPKDTVIDITIEPDDDITLSDLHLDLSKYTKKRDHEILDAYYYADDSKGFRVAVVDGLVRYLFYEPTDKDAQLKCAPLRKHVQQSKDSGRRFISHN